MFIKLYVMYMYCGYIVAIQVHVPYSGIFSLGENFAFARWRKYFARFIFAPAWVGRKKFPLNLTTCARSLGA